MTITTPSRRLYVDPEDFVSYATVQATDSDTLAEGLENARYIWNTCGGHWRAARMERAINNITTELASRGSAA